jgi:hypothetical protein
MISDSNDELSSAASPGKRKSASPKSNLEFDFGKAKASISDSKITTTTPSSKTFDNHSRPSSVANGRNEKTGPIPSSYVESLSSEQNYRSTTNPQPSKTMSSNPSFAQFQQNVQRQSREQRAVGSLLSGVAVALLVSIILVAALAGYGVYILSQQIKQQSATVAQLDSKMSANFELLQTSLKETASAVDTLNSQTQAQKQQIQSVFNQLETIRSQNKADRAALETRLKKLDVRLLEVERQTPGR